MSWPKVALGEVCEFRSGNAWKAKQFSDDHSGIPIIRIQNVGDEASKEYVYWTDEFDHRFLVERGDLLLSLSGSFRVARWSGPKALLNQRIVKIDPKSSVDRNWLTYALKSVVGAIEKMGRHALVNNVSMTDLRNFTLPLPPLEEQKRIAAILDKADELRRLRRRAIERLDTLAQSIFYDMFGDPVHNSRMFDVAALGELVRIRRGGSPRPIKSYLGGTIPWIKIGDATKGDPFYLWSTKEKILETGVSRSTFVEPESLIFANCGVSLGFARISKIAGCIHDGWLVFDEFDERLNKLFLVSLINQITPYLRSIAPDGTQPNLNTAIMGSLKIILPPIECQNRFVVAASHLRNQNDRLLAESRLFESLFVSLQQRAFRGEL